MKKLFTLVLALCLLFMAASEAFADGWFTKQPESATTENGQISFSVAVKGNVSSYTWYFVDPETGRKISGKKLAKKFKAQKLKVYGPNRAKIALSNVPAELHGWQVYCHVKVNGKFVDSDSVVLNVAGMDSVASVPMEGFIITEQPKSAKVNKKGKITFSVDYSGLANKITWAFINPDNGEKIIGKKITRKFKKLKISGVNKKTLTLSNVPDEMVGWSVYAHLKFKGTEVNTELARILGPDEDEPVAETTPVQTKPFAEEKMNGGENIEENGEDGEPDVPEDRTITVSCTARALRRLTASGTVEEGTEPLSSLEFTNSGSFLVTSEDPIKSYTINGIQIEWAEPVKEFKIMNVNADLSISLKINRASAASAQVDESHMCRVVCNGCTFTYLRGGLRAVTEGVVPAGAPINITADTYELAAAGYRINGADPVSQGMTSFRLIVTEDITVSTR